MEFESKVANVESLYGVLEKDNAKLRWPYRVPFYVWCSVANFYTKMV